MSLVTPDLGLLVWFDLAPFARLSHIDSRRVESVYEIRRVVFLNHLDTGPAVLCDLVNVRALHQTQADIMYGVDCMRFGNVRPYPASNLPLSESY